MSNGEPSIKKSSKTYALSVEELMDRLNKVDEGRQIVFCFDHNRNEYHKIDGFRIDSQGDVILDISYATNLTLED